MNSDSFDKKLADDELHNWGRFVHDTWLHHHLLYTNPPTSDGYIAPIVAHDDPEPVAHAIDEHQARQTENIVVHIGLSHFESFEVLGHWYTRIMRAPLYSIENRSEYGFKRLAKKMRTSYPGAQRMLEEAQYRYWLHRELARLTHRQKFARISGGL